MVSLSMCSKMYKIKWFELLPDTRCKKAIQSNWFLHQYYKNYIKTNGLALLPDHICKNVVKTNGFFINIFKNK